MKIGENKKKIDRICDYVILVYAPIYLRKKRALKRKGMKKSTLNKIINSQLGDNIKKKTDGDDHDGRDDTGQDLGLHKRPGVAESSMRPSINCREQ